MNIHILNIGLHIDIVCIFHSTSSCSIISSTVVSWWWCFQTTSGVFVVFQFFTSLCRLGCFKDSASSPKSTHMLEDSSNTPHDPISSFRYFFIFLKKLPKSKIITKYCPSCATVPLSSYSIGPGLVTVKRRVAPKRPKSPYVQIWLRPRPSKIYLPGQKITWLTPVSETKSETDCMAVYRNRFSRNGHHIIYIAHTDPGSIFRCELINIHLQFLISRLPWNDWTNGHEPYLKCTLAIFHAPRPELRVSHRSSCALTDIHRDITGRSQGHYQSGYLQPVFTDLPISLSPLSDGPGNFARIYK